MNAENKAKTLTDQANKMRAKATKAQAAQSMLKAGRAADGGHRDRAPQRPGREDQVPRAGAVRQDAADRGELSKSYGSLEVFTDVDLAIDKGSRVVILGLNGAGKTTLLRILGGIDAAGHRRGAAGARPQARVLRPGARDARHQPPVLENMRHAAPQLTDTEARSVLGSFLFSGDDAAKPAVGALRR